MSVRDPILNTAVRMNTGEKVARRKMCLSTETPSSSFFKPNVKWLSAAVFPIIAMELVIDMSPVVVVSLAQNVMRATKMSWKADSLLLSARLAFRESFFISGPWTKRARTFTDMVIAAVTAARLNRIELDSTRMS